MFSLTKWLVAPVLAAGLMFAADAQRADAGGFSLSIGNGGFGYNNFGGGYRSYRPAYGNNFGGGYRYGYGAPAVIVAPHSGYHGGGYRSNFRGGGHYDYHPQQVYRHGNHFDVVPGHYDYHRGGHHGHH